MSTARLSTKGQIVIPQAIRRKHGWQSGQDFVIEEADGSVLLRPKPLFAATAVEDVFGCLEYDGPPVSVEDMDTAVRQAVRAQWTEAERNAEDSAA